MCFDESRIFLILRKIISKLFLILIFLDLSKRFNIDVLPITIMGDMRKDYVSERFMIVSKKDNKITVVEVKTRYGPQFYWPEESISNKKINNIYITYQLLARQEKLSEFFYLDAFIIEINGSKAKIRRYQI